MTEKPASSAKNDQKITRLKPKRERFCQEYVIDLNGTQAAIRAGYSPKSARDTACSLLIIPDVQARIKELEKPVLERLGINHEYVLKGLKTVYEQAVKAVPVMKFDYEEKTMVETGEYEFDSGGANRALELLGKHMKMFTDKVDHTTKGKAFRQPPVFLVDNEQTAAEIKSFIDRENNGANRSDD